MALAGEVAWRTPHLIFRPSFLFANLIDLVQRQRAPIIGEINNTPPRFASYGGAGLCLVCSFLSHGVFIHGSRDNEQTERVFKKTGAIQA